MPTTHVDYSEASDTLNASQNPSVPGNCFVSTPFGLSILEIQGELNLPSAPPTNPAGVDPEYLGNFAKVDDIYDAVKFGRMEFDESNPSRVVLYIGKSQRLLGSVETLREPLGVLKVSTVANKDDNSMKFMDVIHKKIIFKQRPLPIM